MRGGEQLAFGRRAGAPHGGANAPALLGYFLIGDSGAAHFEFIRAVAGEDQVGMRIHETGSYYSSPGIDDLCVPGEERFDVAA